MKTVIFNELVSTLLEEKDSLVMDSEMELQKLNIEMCNHRWLIRMLSEMSEFAKLNGLQEVGVVMDFAKESTATAIDAYEQRIVQSRNTAFSRMLR